MTTNYLAGHDAEQKAAEYLRSLGFIIRDTNWQNRYCEIDIVAEKSKTIFFVEAKYRKTTDFGTGLDYITPKKLQKMKFAAELWVSQYDWKNDYRLGAIELTGQDMAVTAFIESL